MVVLPILDKISSDVDVLPRCFVSLPLIKINLPQQSLLMMFQFPHPPRPLLLAAPAAIPAAAPAIPAAVAAAAAAICPY